MPVMNNVIPVTIVYTFSISFPFLLYSGGMVNNSGLSKAQLKQKKKNKITLISSIILVVLILSGIGVWLVLNPIPTATPSASDFNDDVPLSENLKVAGVDWNVVSADFKDTPTGEWVLDDSTGQLTNEQYPGCFMFWSKVASGVDDGTSDADNTESFINGLNGEVGEPVYVDVEGEKGKVEFANSRLIDETGGYTLSYARYVAGEGLILFGKFTCETSEELDKVVDGRSVSDFGVALIRKD